MGLVFEEICKQYMLIQMKKNNLPFPIGKIGRWWGSNAKLKRQEEIDILVFHKDNAIFCECKWTNSLVDTDVLRDLMEQSSLFDYKNMQYYIFAKTGFTEKLVKETENNSNVKLICFDDML